MNHLNNVNKNNLDVLFDFASQVQLKRHGYIALNDRGEAHLSFGKRDWGQFKQFIKIIKKTPISNQEDLRKLKVAYDILEKHLSSKIKGVSSVLVSQENKTRIEGLIADLKKEKERVAAKIEPGLPKNGIDSLSEEEARLKFYQTLPQKLSVKHAANLNELYALKEISKRIWEADPLKYNKIMLNIYQGEHVLIEEDPQNASIGKFKSYDALKQWGAKLRGSSHYDMGLKKYFRLPEKENEVENPQFEIWGHHVKELLFGRVKMAVKNGLTSRPVYGKTYDQAIKAGTSRLNPKKVRYFTWFQLEGARDSSKPYNVNFWRHRMRDFPTYIFRKLRSFERVNIGPYGFGHGDKNPTVLKLSHN